jgi:hypothetical protein
MVRPALKYSYQAILGCAVRKSVGLALMRKSGPASKNFCEFVGTFAGNRKTLVGGLPGGRLPDIAFAPCGPLPS